MSILQVIILAIVQGLAELLPVSSSAHVVVAEKLLGLDPSSPQMTLLLVMLHTGTMSLSLHSLGIPGRERTLRVAKPSDGSQCSQSGLHC
jgi:hypothetical protein